MVILAENGNLPYRGKEGYGLTILNGNVLMKSCKITIKITPQNG